MFKIYRILYWVSGLLFGLMIGAFIACPYWKIVVPLMLLLSFFTAREGYKQEK